MLDTAKFLQYLFETGTTMFPGSTVRYATEITTRYMQRLQITGGSRALGVILKRHFDHFQQYVG